MSETRSGRRSGGRAARQALRAHAVVDRVPYVTRTMTPFEVLSEEGLELIEHNADTILEQVGIEFRDAPDALDLLRDAGADVEGERVRFPRGMCRRIVQATAPRTFTQVARNPANSVEIGGTSTVFAPAYGSPFVTDLDQGRRYGTIEDFRNFVKLAYVSPYLHHSGGTVCEPVDLPVEQAALRHGLRPPALFGQAVHGLRHPSGARPGHGRDGADRVRRRVPGGAHGDPAA